MSTETIRPFSVNVPRADLDDLRDRIVRTRYAQDLPGVGWSYGVPTDRVRDLAAHWAEGFDWRAWEARLNAYPQFTTEIDGETLHGLHIRSRNENATPLVLLHGWPGSILEFIHVIEPLTNPVAHGGSAEDAFHLVIPSMPGFGLSGPTHSTGWDGTRMARAIAEVMRRLGYERYAAQGGDFGSFVAPELGRVDGDRVIGVHVNAATYGFIPWGEADEAELATFDDTERVRLARLQGWNESGSGYFQIQATRPQTIGLALADSPVGQLAWIYDKFKEWAFDPAGGDESVIDRDVILAHATLYWLTNTAGSSARMYYETMHTENWPQPSTVPTGVEVFAEDVAIRRYGEQSHNVVHWSDFERGGHFAALEAPDLLVGDIRAFFGGLRAG